jgi:hypothetical protein
MRNTATASAAAAIEGRHDHTDDEGLHLDPELQFLIDELVIPVLLERLTTETVEQQAA